MVPAVGAMILLSYGVSRGVPLDVLCSVIGCAPHQLTDPQRMVPFETSLALWRTLIARLPEENIAVGVGSFVRLEHYGMFWEFAKHVASPLEFLRGFVRFAPFGDTAYIDDPVALVQVGRVYELRWPASLKYGIAERIETLNIALLSCMRRIASSPIYPAFVRSTERPTHKRCLAERAYGCEVSWGCADDALCFDEATLRRPFPNAQPQAARALMDLLERKLLPDARLPLAERLRRVVELQVQAGEASQRSVARALGLSVRTLQRALQQQGLRFSDVLGAAIKRVATELMRDGARSLEDIAVELGYSEPSSFARTWRRLTGESPARYRSRLLREGTSERGLPASELAG
jgi:AraC-like DNA-binding protein